MFRSSYRGFLLKPSNLLLALFSLFVFFYLFFSPSLATPAYPQDTFFILSDGWRFANGQIPYRDYHSALGPLSGLMTGLGMLLCPPGSGLAHGVLIGQGIFLLLLLPVSVFVAYRRLRAPYGALFCFLIVSLLAGRIVLGDPFSSHLTVTGTYNSQGYALALVFGLLVLLRPQAQIRATATADNLLGGLLLLMLFFDKLSYFGAGIALLAAAIVGPRLMSDEKTLGVSGRNATGIVAAFVVVMTLILLGFGISPLRIIADNSGLVHAQMAKMTGDSRLQRIPKILFDALRQYALLLLGFPLLLSVVYGRLSARREILLVLLGLYLLAISVVVMMGNSLQAADLFLLLLLAFVVGEVFARQATAVSGLGAVAVCAFLGLTVLQHQAIYVLSTVRAAAVEFRAGKSPNPWLAGTGLADLVVPQNEGVIDMLSPPPANWTPIRTVRAIDAAIAGEISMFELSQIIFEGRCLLDRNLSPQDLVFTDGDYGNIHSMMLRQPPTQGGSLGFSNDFNVSLTPDDVRGAFSNATLIMAPRNNVTTTFFVGSPASQSVMKGFAQIGQSRYWSLWRRKGTTAPAPLAACPAGDVRS